MLDVATIVILFIAFVVEAFIVIKLRKQSYVLLAALLFLVNVILFVILHVSYNKITDPGEITNMNSMDFLLDFNLYSVKVRNSVILIGMLALAIGLHHQYGLKKRRIYLISSFTLGAVTILWLVLAMMAGGFTI